MKNIMKEAHKLTKEIKAEYPNVDYKAQLGICISYLYNLKEEDKMKKILSKNDLLNCKYEGPRTGWRLNGEKLPDKIETEIGLLYYMMGEGYVILTVVNGKIDWHNFVKLTDFIGTESEKTKKDENIILQSVKKDNYRVNHRNNYIQEGYFQCWECGSIEPLSKRQDDGTCGCL